jgi:hypothetical protein
VDVHSTARGSIRLGAKDREGAARGDEPRPAERDFRDEGNKPGRAGATGPERRDDLQTAKPVCRLGSTLTI